jgi:hypothetical protein
MLKDLSPRFPSNLDDDFSSAFVIDNIPRRDLPPNQAQVQSFHKEDLAFLTHPHANSYYLDDDWEQTAIR